MSSFHAAEYYELLGNRGGRLEREGPFLLEALAGAPSSRVVDLASGLGLHAHYLAEQGAEVDALDLSSGMTDHAQKQRPHARINYRVADMRHPQGGPYGLALCLGNSLCLLEGKDDLKLFFQGVAEVLQPGGLLITQTLNYDKPVMKKSRIRVEQESRDNMQLVAVKTFQPEATRTRLTIHYYEATPELLRESREESLLQHWTAEELINCATEAGMKVESSRGAYDGAPLTPDSTDIIFLFRKEQ
ncbi:MAG: class I SAM-dependent methyltransferase [Candidatus Hydrogenedens sp.]|jgi:cyclopropane fatty-acyl-phospholipid synthase-like methyltransferase|nr:class I SAM-dependent methyltransferase [Candidatus Hydrogenedens sp.]